MIVGYYNYTGDFFDDYTNVEVLQYTGQSVEFGNISDDMETVAIIYVGY